MSLDGSFLFTILPEALRTALQAEGTPAATVVNEVLISALSHSLPDNAAEAASSTHELSDLVSSMLVEAIGPLAQRLMQSMNSADRLEGMDWLSDPAPVAEAMHGLMDVLLADSDQARELAESAVAMATSVPEVAAFLEQESGGIPPPAEVLAELQLLASGGIMAQPIDPLEQQQMAHAAEVAADAAATAGASARPLESVGSSGPQPRKSRRIAGRRRSCPLLVLDDDAVGQVLRLLDLEVVVKLQYVSTGWREQARGLLNSDDWCAGWGCIYAGEEVRVLGPSTSMRLPHEPQPEPEPEAEP